MRFFGSKRKSMATDQSPVINIELVLNQFNKVTKEQFEQEVQKYFNLETFGSLVSESATPKIFIGDVDSSGLQEVNQSDHLLIVGNIKGDWVNLASKIDSQSQGSLFVTGNVELDYFSSDFGKVIMINGSLLVKSILNTEFEDACLIVNKDLITEYFHGIDIWGDVKGYAKMDYGWGYCLDSEGKVVLPKNDFETSLAFLEIDESCDSKIIDQIIQEKVNNAF